MPNKTKFYSVSEIQGKGLGCVAITEIKKGTLILRESAGFHHFGDSYEYIDKAYLDGLFQGYLTMSNEEKEKYLSLANCFSDPMTPSTSSAGKMEDVLKYLKDGHINLGSEEAQLVFQIYHTNCFHNGIFLEMSRFNHSCTSNAEYLWNEDTGTRDVRAIRKIKKGGEITINYNIVDAEERGMTRDERRAYLKEIYHFHCNCIGCDLSEDELKIQNEKCGEYRKIVSHMKEQDRVNELIVMRTSDTSSEVDDLKALYKLAKELKIVRHRIILRDIAEEGFDAACQGYLTMIEILKSANSTVHKEKRDNFWQNLTCFANAGYDISKVVNGPEHSDTLDWQKMKQDPIAFFNTGNFICWQTWGGWN